MAASHLNPENVRLAESDSNKVPWKLWGPYLSERQWGTVREDYSADGNAWDYFTHDQSRSRAYRWGEDGLAGVSDEKQRLCFALALWNGQDPILKERLFGLTNSEGNHGEDCKEYYFYLDSTPTHSYMKYLYKYPQRAFPYQDLVETNRRRTRKEMEYELLDTGVFADNRYFDVFVEYFKNSPTDLLVQFTVENRGPEASLLHLLPTLWFRNTWTWSGEPRPEMEARGGVVRCRHAELGEMLLYCDGEPELLFTENETNQRRLYGSENSVPFVKDAFHELVVGGQAWAVNPAQTGTKTAAYYKLMCPPGESRVVRLRLTAGALAAPFADFETVAATRRREADEYFDWITPDSLSEDRKLVTRQALGGMMWTKQYYHFDLDRWLEENRAHPLVSRPQRKLRNAEWFHMINDDIISMPDKWEYPWYAAWDLAFHTLPLSMIDPKFAKRQLLLMLRELYLHPNGQIPAYEWNFGDVNPPVHAWATIFIYNSDKLLQGGKGDLEFLRDSFQKLLLNFTWWVNRKDPTGRNVFEGGFLGLDNIGVFDRSAKLPTGGHLEQADGTAWMALFCTNMLEIAVELAKHDPFYGDICAKFAEHFFWISAAMDRWGDRDDEMWDEADGFFYDVLRLPDGTATRLKVRSLVGLLPLCAVTVFEEENLLLLPRTRERIAKFIQRNPELIANIASPLKPGVANRRILSVVNEEKLRRVLKVMLDEKEFLSDYGIRSLSKYHRDIPYVFRVHGEEHRVDYLPAESDTGMFGGNSNWRGPVWMPVNALIVRSLLQYHTYYGEEFRIECPTGSGVYMNLFEVARDITRRLENIFVREDGRRAVYGGTEKFQNDPHWRDLILFYEYFHGDNGAGLGASHQTGWTGVIARLMQMFETLTSAELAAGGAAKIRELHRD
ncbi:MAG: glucosidase [Bryobacteraceae bacterium]|nr:glucosidase [Bryobacteraceae bacterium]